MALFDPGPIERALRHYWRSHVWDWAFLAAGVVVAGWLFYRPQIPGIAIAVLALAAVVMTVREMRTVHKILWILVAGVLFAAELRAISADRAALERQHVADQTAINLQFKGILDESNKEFAATQDKFAKVLGDTQTLNDKAGTNLDLARENLLNLNGGGVIPLFDPTTKPSGDGGILRQGARKICPKRRIG